MRRLAAQLAFFLITVGLTGCQTANRRVPQLVEPETVRAQSIDPSYPRQPEPDDVPKGSEPDIRSPGPDTANFPNSPYTLPKGRAYVEASPVFLSGPSRGSAKTYNAEFLLRYGLTDKVEFRLFGNGPTAERGRYAASGFAPLAFDLKMNFWEEKRGSFIPAVGLEVFLLTPTGSGGLNQGTQPSINLLFDHTLPLDILFEWNIGFVGDPSPNSKGSSSLEPIFEWAFQRSIVDDFDVFIHGYYNGPTLPRFGDGVVVGAGFLYTPRDRFSVFGSYNAGVSSGAPTTLFQLGGALAF
jgi:hypothetical protein